MIDLLGDHRANHADVVRHLLMIGQKIADRLTAIAVPAELGERSLALQLLVLQLGDRLAGGEGLRHRLAIESGQLRLVIKRFQMRRPARHAQKDHAFDPRRVVRQLAAVSRVDRWRASRHRRPGEQRCQGNAAQAQVRWC